MSDLRHLAARRTRSDLCSSVPPSLAGEPEVTNVMKLRTLMTVASLCLVAFVGCAAETEEDEGDTATSEDKLLAGRQLDESEVADLLRDAGFPEKVVPTMVCTAKWESAFFERAYNKNK